MGIASSSPSLFQMSAVVARSSITRTPLIDVLYSLLVV